MTRSLLAVFAGLLLLGVSFAWVQAENGASFSRTEVKSIRALKGSNGCPEFEATFTGPLKSQPNARLDIESAFGFNATISRLLDVLTVSPTRVRLSIHDAEACRAMREAGHAASVSLENARGADGRPILPTEKTFRFK